MDEPCASRLRYQSDGPDATLSYEVAEYRFEPKHLAVAERKPGISAFMRIRDGAFSLEAAIRSHIDHFDEIVAVHNRSTDATPDILGQLHAKYGDRLRVFHYLPPVFPPGSAGHAKELANSPLSLVNYYNFALTRTRFTHVTKLDDDHVAMGDATAKLVADVRAGRAANNEMACFSGINLARDEAGRVGVLRREPYSGSGDIGIFPVTPDTFFVHDRRFEVLQLPGMRRRFHSFVYWHLKYLKPEFGFANYDLKDNPRSRYIRRLEAHRADREVIELSELAESEGRLNLLRFTERQRIVAARGREAARAFAGRTVEQMAPADPELLPFIRP
jgi:hypothetical protein